MLMKTNELCKVWTLIEKSGGCKLPIHIFQEGLLILKGLRSVITKILFNALYYQNFNMQTQSFLFISAQFWLHNVPFHFDEIPNYCGRLPHYWQRIVLKESRGKEKLFLIIECKLTWKCPPIVYPTSHL